MSGTFLHGVEPAEVIRRVRSKDRERVVADDFACIQVVRASSAKGDRPVAGGTNHREAHPVVLGQSVEESRMGGAQLLERGPTGMLGEVHEAEVARGADDEVGTALDRSARLAFVTPGTELHRALRRPAREQPPDQAGSEADPASNLGQ